MKRMKVFGFAGWSGSGKTTLIESVIPLLVAHGLTVSLVKHAHHTFDVDHPGKDSWRHRQAGCQEVLLTSSRRWALLHELRGADEMPFREALRRLSPCDLALVEGFKRLPIPKLEVWRAAVKKPLLHPADPSIVGIATDEPGRFAGGGLPVLDLSNAEAVADFVRGHAKPLPIDKEALDL
jgi:molybdopterin-guanine dinucleotide biosynthesis protein B